MSWTDERVEKLREYWAEGMTASQIAKALGGVSRNAVIGKVHRLGLSHRAGAGKAPSGDGVEEASREVSKSTTVEAPVVEADAPDVEVEEQKSEGANVAAALAAEVERNARKLTLLELNERTCKWPIGDPSTDDFYFCGLPCASEKPYCSAHVAVAYQPMSSRRDRDRSRTRAVAS